MALVAVLPRAGAEAGPEGAVDVVSSHGGAMGVLLRLLNPRLAFPEGGASRSELGRLRGAAPSRCDAVAGVLSWLSCVVPILAITVWPMPEFAGANERASLGAALQASVPAAIDLAWIHGLYLTFMDAFVGGVHPLRRYPARRLLTPPAIFVGMFAVQALLFAAVGYVPFNALFTIAANLYLCVGLLYRPRLPLQGMVDLSVFLSWSCMLPAVVPCLYSYALVKVGAFESGRGQLLLAGLYELLLWAVKVALRRSRLGPDMGVLFSEGIVEGLLLMMLFSSFTLLTSWRGFAVLLLSQSVGVVVPVLLAQDRWRPALLPRSGPRRPEAERLQIAALRVGVTCTLHVWAAATFVAFTLAARHGSNADTLVAGSWSDAEAARAMSYAAVWGATFALMLALAPRGPKSPVSPVREVWRATVQHTQLVQAATCSVVAMLGALTMRAHQVMWWLLPEDGYRS